MVCEKCNCEIAADESHQHAGLTLCEDCFIDASHRPVACDPWAVHTARTLTKDGPTLTGVQQKILDLIGEEGPLTAEDICAKLELDLDEFQRNFASLRHMELARGLKKGDMVYFTLFDDHRVSS